MKVAGTFISAGIHLATGRPRVDDCRQPSILLKSTLIFGEKIWVPAGDYPRYARRQGARNGQRRRKPSGDKG
jgi:hypothetical protein